MHKNAKQQQKARTQNPRQHQTQLARPIPQAGQNNKPAPMALGSSRSVRNYFDLSAGPAKYPGSIRVKGCDFLKSVKSTALAPIGTTLFNFWLTPTSEDLNGTRLLKFGQMYDKYLFRKIRFHVLADNPSTTNGSVLSAFDKDVGDETPPANVQGLQQFNSMYDCARGKVWENHTLDVRLTDPQDWYYTNYLAGLGDMRVAYQGQYYLAIMSESATANTFQIWIEYDVELYDPQLEASAAEVGLRVNDGTPSYVAGAGFNGLVAQNAASQIKFGTDLSGNKYLEIPEGAYALMQSALVATTGGSFSVPTALANIPDKQSQLIRTTLETQGAANGGNAVRNDLFDIPVGGAKIYGNFNTWTSGAIGAYIVRMMRAGSSWK